MVDEAPANWGRGFGHLRSSAPSPILFSDNLRAVLHADWLGEVLFSYNEKIINHVTGFCLGEGI